MVEHYLAKVIVGVRFSSLAPFGNSLTGSGVIINSGHWPQDYWAGRKICGPPTAGNSPVKTSCLKTSIPLISNTFMLAKVGRKLEMRFKFS